jgi:hypothetical protein
MHSGGGLKEPPYSLIYIEAPEEEAKVIFYNRFGHNPERVSCTCCGDDYSIEEDESLAQLSGYHRGCRTLVTPRDPKTGLYQNDDPVIIKHLYLEDGEDPPEGYEVDKKWPTRGNYQTLEEHERQESVLVISASEISSDERRGGVPEQGYVWKD